MRDINILEIAILDIAVNGINPMVVYLTDEFSLFHGRSAGVSEPILRSTMATLEKKGWIAIDEEPRNDVRVTALGGDVWCKVRNVDFELFYRSHFSFVDVDGTIKERVSIEAYNADTCWTVAGASILPQLKKGRLVAPLDLEQVNRRLHYWREVTTFYRISYFEFEEGECDVEAEELEKGEYEDRLRRRGIWAGRPEW